MISARLTSYPEYGKEGQTKNDAISLKTYSNHTTKMEQETKIISKPTEPNATIKTKGKFKNTLTKKEKGFVKDYVKTGNGTEAALKNYDTKKYNTASAIATENLKKPHIVKAILSIADQIPDKLLAKRHLELLNKREHIKIDDEIEDVGPDTQAVSKGLDMAYKLKGAYAPEKSMNLNLNQPISVDDVDIQAIADRIEEELKKKYELHT